MKWFRLYGEVLHDSKVQVLSPARFRDWINLLLVANGNSPRGYLPAINQVSFLLRISVAEAQAAIEELTEAGLFDIQKDGTLKAHNWDIRQPESDNAALRMKARRDQAKAIKPKSDTKKKRTSSERVPNESQGPIGGRSENVQNEFRTNSENVPPRLEEKRKETDNSASSPASDLGSGSFDECLFAVADYWGDQNANRLKAKRQEIAGRLNAAPDPEAGSCQPRWDCYLAAAHDLKRRLGLPGVKTVHDPVFYIIPAAQDFMVNGIPPEPVEAPVIAPAPRRRTNGDDTVLPPPFRPTEEQLARFGPPPGAPKPPDAAGPPRFKNITEFAAEFAARKNLTLRRKDEP